MNNKIKSAFAATELVVGIVLSVVVFFVIINMFGDNLSNITANTNLKNIFTKNDKKTDYESFDRNYSSSQINVQITGEQGLTTLRKEANNAALSILNSELTDSNSNTVAYLSSIIQKLTGEPSICIKMEKDSNETCDKLGGYTYEIAKEGADIKVQEVEPNKMPKGNFRKHRIDASLSQALNQQQEAIDKYLNLIKNQYGDNLTIVFTFTPME